MKSSEPKRRFPPPWTVERTGGGYVAKDANGVTLAHVYCPHEGNAEIWDSKHLTSDEARRIAKAIARLPEFLRTHPDFVQRRLERRGRYWKATHPYHVALQDAYVQENYDEIVACCRYNNVPFDATGEKLERGMVRWLTYEFARQFDAIRFWDKFEGKWMLNDEFIFPECPKDLPKMKSLKHKGAI